MTNSLCFCSKRFRHCNQPNKQKFVKLLYQSFCQCKNRLITNTNPLVSDQVWLHQLFWKRSPCNETAYWGRSLYRKEEVARQTNLAPTLKNVSVHPNKMQWINEIPVLSHLNASSIACFKTNESRLVILSESIYLGAKINIPRNKINCTCLTSDFSIVTKQKSNKRVFYSQAHSISNWMMCVSFLCVG